MRNKRILIKIQIPLESVYDGLYDYIYEDVPIKSGVDLYQTLIGKPIIKNDVPIGYISSINKEKGIVEGYIWTNVITEVCIEDNKMMSIQGLEFKK